MSNASERVLRRSLVIDPLADTRPEQPTSSRFREVRGKRLFDIVTTVMLLLALAPVLLTLIIVMGLQDGGPVFYGHQRVGRGGRPFRCLKFRTMCTDADGVLQAFLESDHAAREEWEATGKLRNDPRVSRLGRVMRSTSLDELPQLWNVLRGDMSLVGPRPITFAEIQGPYGIHGGGDDYIRVRPGITGLWQISGRSRVGYKERVALDQRYVKTQSFTSDMSIICRTVTVVLRRDGAC